MGQQQLLLIVLGVIIVGIAIAVGISMFKSSAVDANRNAVASDLANLASKAQRYYRTPVELGGGGNSFANFALSPLDTGNANGSYRVEILTGDQAIVIHALGREKIGDRFVAAVDTVDADRSRIFHGTATSIQTDDPDKGHGKLPDFQRQ
ncbi:MAG: type IV pilin protein [Candidatus Kryptonium sp.]